MLRVLLLAIVTLVCVALADNVSSTCVASFSANHKSLQACDVVSRPVMEELARNCTEGDLTSAYTVLAAYCDEAQRQNAAILQTTTNEKPATTSIPTAERVSRMVMRRSPANSYTSSPEISISTKPVEARDLARQSSSCASYKYQSATRKPVVTNGFSLGTIFAERSVRFAISGLLVTTLTSFLFL